MTDINFFENHAALKLVEKINQAFGHVAYPGDDVVISFEDHCGSYERELKNLMKYSRNQSWTAIPLETLIWDHDSLPFISPEAYDFFIPAFMVSSIVSFFFHSDSTLLWYTSVSLCRQSEDLIKKHSDENICQQHKYLSKMQKSVIKEFLVFSAEILKEDGDDITMIERTLNNSEIYLND